MIVLEYTLYFDGISDGDEVAVGMNPLVRDTDADGYLDADTFQWETVANVSDKELNELKSSQKIHLFVRKVDSEDGIRLPFTYIGEGRMEYIEGSKKANGAHLFRVPMKVTAPEDIFFDFRLQ